MSESELLEFIRTQLKLRTIEPSSEMGKVRGWDSLRHLQLILALEERFEIEIPPDLIGQLITAQALVDYVRDAGKLAV